MHTHAVPVLQWISQLVGTTSGEQPPGFDSPALDSATPLTTHLQCHPEIAVAAIGMCELCRCIDCWHRIASFSGFPSSFVTGSNLGMRLNTQYNLLLLNRLCNYAGLQLIFTENMFRSVVNNTSHHLCNLVLDLECFT